MSYLRISRYKPSFKEDKSIFSESFEVEVGFDDVPLNDDQLQSFQAEMVKCRELVVGAYQRMPSGHAVALAKTSAEAKAKDEKTSTESGKITPVQVDAITKLADKGDGRRITDEYLRSLRYTSIMQLSTDQAATLLRALRR